ncbi:putative multidrug resistance protein [Clavispora lusitaniae]|uniref:Multidrug resistance protein n=1 Tax=Clavispora lusitaniae TaxID=36911 RepID=A0AA91T3B3_CLALS|nr:putative multidrug resistance protein [Clavispora lusitaniae]
MEGASHSEPEKTLPESPMADKPVDVSHQEDYFTPAKKQTKVTAPDNSNKSRPPVFRRRTSKRFPGILHEDGRRELREKDCYDKLGFCFPTYKKWMILSVIFAVQVSMNFNTSIYPNAIPLIAEKWNIEVQKVRVSQMMFLICYAFGCELWAPWSEEYGRWPIMQLSLFFVNIWQILGGLAPNFGAIVVARSLGGLSSAGGSVTLGMTADMWEANDQGFAVAFVVLSSVGGSALGPIFGGLAQEHLSFRWNFWIQLIFGGVVQIAHFFLVSETRATALIDREAKRRRESGEDDNIYGPGEIYGHKMSFGEVLRIWRRPFEMFLKEPIVLCLSLLSGFSDALIFVCMESFTLVYKQWNFSTTACGLAFVPIVIGYLLAYGIHLPDVWRQRQIIKTYGDGSRFAERRLLLLLFIAPLEAIGLFGFAWTSMGPHYNPWIAPMIFTVLIAIANYSIYMSTIDYMVAAYGPYSASATGGNGFARDFLAGIAAMYSEPMYTNIGKKRHLQWASTLLGCIAFLVSIPIYIFYWKGPQIRERSKFAQTLAADKKLRDTVSSDEEEEEELKV